MKKNITVIIPGTNPDKIKKLVKDATNTAAYSGQLQFIFVLRAGDKACADVVHELYMKFPPDIFDPFPIPTIKTHLINSSSVLDNVRAAATNADADIIIFETEDAEFKIRNWDKSILETFDMCKDGTEEEVWEALGRLKIKLGIKNIEQKNLLVK